MAWPKGRTRKPKEVVTLPPAEELKEAVIPKAKVIDSKSAARCVHGIEHHDPEKKWCNSCGCLHYNECGA